MKYFKRFLVFLFAVFFTAITPVVPYVKAANDEYELLGWKNLSDDDSVISVTMSGSRTLPKYTGPDMSRDNAITFSPYYTIYFTVHLKDGYELDFIDNNIYHYLAGVQTNTQSISGSEYIDSITTPYFDSEIYEQDQEFYLYFKTRKNDQVINNVTLNIARPLCGTSDKPQVSCPEDSNYSVYGTSDWVEKEYDEYLNLDVIENIVIEGEQTYTFATNIVPNQNYKFGKGIVDVIINDGKTTSAGGDMFEYYGGFTDDPTYGRTLYGDVLADHVAVESKENVIEPTCTTDGSYESILNCQSCNKEISRSTETTEATGHDWGEWTVTKEPTKTDKGEKTRICKNDPSHVQTKEIPARGENKPEITYYKVAFDNKGLGVAPKTQTVKSGETATEPNAMYAMGYSFCGWYTDENLTEPFDFDTPITSDITLYAKWTSIATGMIKTGDSSNIALHCHIIALSLTGIMLLYYSKSKRKSLLPK